MRSGPALTLWLGLALSCNGSKSPCEAGSTAERSVSFPVSVPGRAAKPLVVYTADAVPPPGPARAEVTGLALQGRELYVVDSVDGVLRASMDGEPTLELAAFDQPLARPTVAAEHLYLIGDRDLVSIPRPAGGPASVIRGGLTNPRDLAIAGQYAYLPTGMWLGQGPNGADGEIVRIALHDGTRVALATAQPGPIAVAADEDHVYWTCQGAVMRVAAAGGKPEAFAEFGDDYPWHIALEAEHVYTLVQTGLGADLYRLRKRDSASERLAHINAMPPSIAIGDGAIHFVAESDQPNLGTLWRLGLRDARLVTVATGLPPSCCVAADDEHLAWASGRDVFWMEHATHEVHRAVMR